MDQSVHQGTSPGGQSPTPVAAGITGTSTTITGLDNGTTYYTVAAVNDAGSSAPSNEASATPISTPAQVTGLLATTPGNAEVQLRWRAAEGATACIVYVGTSPGSETPIATGVAATSYPVAGLGNRTTYYFTAAGTNSAGTGLASEEVSAKPRRFQRSR